MTVDRRQFLSGSLSLAAAAGLAGQAAQAATTSARSPMATGTGTGRTADFRCCLNTSTIRGQQLGIVEEIRIAAEAGYDGIEPWIGGLTQFVEGGGKLSELKQRIADAGLTVDSAIGFAQWIVDDPEQRRKGLEQARRDMDMVREIGGQRLAAPPAGATQGPKLDLFQVAERYRALLELGEQTGVVPQLEVWGFSTNLSRLGESVFVCTEADHPQACLLPDVYHIFKGGSGFGGLQLLSDQAVHVFHVNDYPAMPARQDMNDSHRVYPGDGVAPLTDILRAIGGGGRQVTLSLELFNKEYWAQDPLQVARTGLERIRACVAAAAAAA